LRKSKWLIPIGIVAVLLIGYWGVDAWSQAKLNRLKAEARRAGMAMSADELRQNPAVAGENAAPYYREAFAKMKALSKDDRYFVLSYDYPDAGDMIARYRLAGIEGPIDDERAYAALKRAQPILDIVDHAARFPRLDWNREWEKGLGLLLPEFAYMKELAKVALFDAHVAAKRGQISTSIRRLETARAIAKQCEEEPILIAPLVSVAIQNLADRKAMQIAYENRRDAEFVARIRQYFLSAPPVPDLRNAFRGEAFHGQLIIDQLPATPEAGLAGPAAIPSWTDPKRLKYESLKLSFVRRGIQAHQLERYARAFKRLPKDPSDWKAVRAAMQGLDKDALIDSDLPPYMAGFVTAPMGNIGDAISILSERRRQGVVFTQILDMARSTGRWPAKLPPGTWATDIYTGAPMGYRVVGEDFMLYSTGPDGVDDGGILSPRSHDLMVAVQGGQLSVVK
jgi:hypothetical protein